MKQIKQIERLEQIEQIKHKKQHYTFSELEKEIAVLKNVFEVVRLVDPVRCVGYELSPALLSYLPQPYPCYHILGKNLRCKNCIAAKAVQDKKSYTKFEFADKEIYYMIAKYIKIDNANLIMEMITNVTENTVLDGKGYNEFIDRVVKFNELIITDDLTGIYNRRFLNEMLPGLISSSLEESGSLAVIIADIDDFKGINDSYGHLVGDQVLCTVARFLERNIRENRGDFVARIGGDEFLLVLNQIERDVAIQRVWDISQKAHNIFVEAQEQEIGVSLSWGMAFAGELREPSLNTLIDCADKRLYRSKNKGKSQIIYHDEE